MPNKVERAVINVRAALGHGHAIQKQLNFKRQDLVRRLTKQKSLEDRYETYYAQIRGCTNIKQLSTLKSQMIHEYVTRNLLRDNGTKLSKKSFDDYTKRLDGATSVADFAQIRADLTKKLHSDAFNAALKSSGVLS